MTMSEILANYDNYGWKFEVIACDDDYGIALTYDYFDYTPVYCIRAVIDDYHCKDNIPHIIRIFLDKEKAEKAYNALTSF